MSELQPVLKILQKQAGLVILGDPGSGKTTFLKYLTLMLASGKGDELGLGERLPILVPLSAYANALSEKKFVRLDDFIADFQGLVSEWAVSLVEIINELSESSEDFQDAYDTITGTTTYESKRTQAAFDEI